MTALAAVDSVSAEPTPAEIVVPFAERLLEEQVSGGPLQGVWAGEEAYTGTIVAGLARAYELTCDGRYLEAAEAGATFFASAAEGNFYGDEAYALTVLSTLPGRSADNPWSGVVNRFYADVKTKASGGTAGYISQYDQAELSVAVFYVANHTVAAYYVDAEDKQVWRRALVAYLSRVDDWSATFPVMALGVATWALALTGPLDDSPIATSPNSSDYWHHRLLRDLPYTLLDHQVATEGPLQGSFFWRFDHGHGGSGAPTYGYTEDLVFASLGLVAAAAIETNVDLEGAIRAAYAVLLGSLEGAERAHQHLSLTSAARHVYAAETLQALAELVYPGDIDLDGRVDAADFTIWAGRWRQSGCPDACRCSRADLDQNGRVDYQDLTRLADDWLDAELGLGP